MQKLQGWGTRHRILSILGRERSIALRLLIVILVFANLFPAETVAAPQNRITVQMEVRRRTTGQKDTASLQFQKGSVNCSLNFHSQESVNYIDNYDSRAVPVVFDLRYSSNGKPSGADLVRIGERDATKFEPGERALTTSQTVRLGEPGVPTRIRIDSPSACFDPLTSLPEKAYFSITTLLPLLLSFVNLGLVAAAFLRSNNRATSAIEENHRNTRLWDTAGLGFAAGSQILYLVLATAWLFRWTRFYPGAPIPTRSIAVGLILSLGAFVTAPFGSGFKRIAGLVAAIITGGLWLLAAVASVAV